MTLHIGLATAMPSFMPAMMPEMEVLRSEMTRLHSEMATKADVVRLGNRFISRLILLLLTQTVLIVALVKLLP